MIKTALHLKDVPLVEVIQRGKNVLAGLTGNPYVPAPMPTLPEIQAAIAAAEAASDAYEMAKVTLRALKRERDVARRELEDVLRAESLTVQVATGGDAMKIVSTGFEIMSEGSPVGVPDQPRNFVLKVTAAEGALKASWLKVRGVRTYEIQISNNPLSATSWVGWGSSTRIRVLMNDLPSGTKVWVRVRALGAAGGGAWSGPVGKMVP